MKVLQIASFLSAVGCVQCFLSTSNPVAFPRPSSFRRNQPIIASAAASKVAERQGNLPALLDWCFKNGSGQEAGYQGGDWPFISWARSDCDIFYLPTYLPTILPPYIRIKRGEQVAMISFSLCLSMESVRACPLRQTVRASPLGLAISGFTPALGDATLIALQILYELSLGASSKYATYLENALPTPKEGQDGYAIYLENALPKEGQDGFDHPLFWSDEVLEVLALSSTRNLKDTLLEAVLTDFTCIKEQILAKGAVSGLGPEAFDLAQFKWAIAVTLSRSFFADNALRLAPLLDMANCGVGQANEPEPAGLGIFGGKGLRIAADRDYKKGDEVLISYGPKSGTEFLEDNGFVPASALHGLCELSFEITEEGDQFFADKEDILKGQKLPMRQSFDLSSDGDVDPYMIQFLRLYNLNDKDAFLLEAVFRQDVWRFLELPLSEANEQAVDEHIIQACSTALENFQKAEKMTEALLKEGKGRKERLDMLSKLRASERTALEAAQAWAERDSTTNDLKEYYQERRLQELQLCGPLSDDELSAAAGGRRTRDLDW